MIELFVFALICFGLGFIVGHYVGIEGD